LSAELRLSCSGQTLSASFREPELKMSSAAAEHVQALVIGHRGELLAFFERRLRSRAWAEELVQAVTVRALAAADALRDPHAGRAWLFRIARRELSEHYRRFKQPRQAIEGHAVEADVDDFGCGCVLANLARLRPEYAFALRRLVIDGVPTIELAKELKLTPNALHVRVYRARAALRERLLEHCGTATLRACLDCRCSERGCCEEERYQPPFPLAPN
jgi:DNA-directed RNA polymerase specialized sigma24 family protein